MAWIGRGPGLPPGTRSSSTVASRPFLFNLRRASREDPGAGPPSSLFARVRPRAIPRAGPRPPVPRPGPTADRGLISAPPLRPRTGRLLAEGGRGQRAREGAERRRSCTPEVVPEKSFPTRTSRRDRRTSSEETPDAWAWARKSRSPRVLPLEPELHAALSSGGDDQPVLRIHGPTLTLANLRRPFRRRAGPGLMSPEWEIYGRGCGNNCCWPKQA